MGRPEVLGYDRMGLRDTPEVLGNGIMG